MNDNLRAAVSPLEGDGIENDDRVADGQGDDIEHDDKHEALEPIPLRDQGLPSAYATDPEDDNAVR